MVAWKPASDGSSSVTYSPVTGSGFGVWALDVSRALEEMAGVEEEDDILPALTASPSHSPPPSPTLVPDTPSLASSSSSKRSSEFLTQCFT